MLRSLDLSEVKQIVSVLQGYERGVTFQYASSLLGVPMSTLSPLMRDLVYFGLVTQKGRIYIPDKENIALWEKYGYCLDYLVLSKSDKAYQNFTERGIHMELEEGPGEEDDA